MRFQIFQLVKNTLRNKTFRHIILTTTKNLAFKIFLIGFSILLIISFAMYSLEKDYIVYKQENGKRVEDTDNSSNIRSLEDSIWWAFVTSTTVGYGDYFPKSTMGRAIGILMMFFGMALVGIITGNIASIFVERQIKEDRGLKELKLKNHFIICGWKSEMGLFLHDIMEKNKSFLPSEIVLVNTANPEIIDNLRMDPTFKHINYVHGDYIDDNVLKMANLKNASKVLILADRLIKGSIEEVDSRTVMVVISIKSHYKSVYTCAELIDSKFERYLRTSNCDEIILSSEYSRAMIANASAGSGISQVIRKLIDVEADVSINTMEIPKKFLGKTFNELSNYYRDRDRSILIGILESTGNFYERKREALEEAQKTPDISKLVDNLKMVKELIPNQPVINPELDYTINKYAKAIIVEGRGKKSILKNILG